MLRIRMQDLEPARLRLKKRNDICPFEKLALIFTTPEEAYKKLRTAQLSS